MSTTTRRAARGARAGKGAARASGRPMTMAGAAALEFEPWEDNGDCSLPKAEEWATMLFTLRLAWRVMFLSKAQLVEAISNEEDVMGDLMKDLAGASGALKGLRALVDGAEMRLLATASAHCEAAKA